MGICRLFCVLLVRGIRLFFCFWIPSLVALISVQCMAPWIVPCLIEWILDFTLEFIYFFGGIALTLLPICIATACKILTILKDVLPVLIRAAYSFSGWLYWLVSEIWLGISGNIDKSTNILSWIILVSFILIYLGRILRGLSMLRTETPTELAGGPPAIVGIQQNCELSEQGSNTSSRESEESRHFSSREEDQRLCVVCLDLDRDTAVFPCGHTHVCHDCITAVIRQSNKCPICLGVIQEFRRVYV